MKSEKQIKARIKAIERLIKAGTFSSNQTLQLKKKRQMLLWVLCVGEY